MISHPSIHPNISSIIIYVNKTTKNVYMYVIYVWIWTECISMLFFVYYRIFVYSVFYTFWFIFGLFSSVWVYLAVSPSWFSFSSFHRRRRHLDSIFKIKIFLFLKKMKIHFIYFHSFVSFKTLLLYHFQLSRVFFSVCFFFLFI